MSQTAVEPGAEVLVRMRKVLGLTQLEVCRRTGIERRKLLRFENGQQNELAPEELDALAALVAQVTLERSELGTLPPDSSVSADSRQRGQKFRQLRLSRGIKQKDVYEAAGVQQGALSMWENGYVELEEDQIERANQALLRLIDKQASQLEWWQNPAELQRRREALGVSRKRLARHCGQNEKWVADLESGHASITAEISEKVWEYLASLEIEQGRTTTLKTALSAPAPVRVDAPTVPLSSATSRKQDAIIVEQKKIIAIREEQYRNSQEANTLLSYIVRELEKQVEAALKLAPQLPASAEQIKAIIQRCHDIINE